MKLSNRVIKLCFIFLVGIFMLPTCKIQNRADDLQKPPRLSLKAYPKTITKGDTVRISWNSDADTVYRKGDTDTVYPAKYALEFQPQESTSYTFVAVRNNRSRTRTVQVTVKDPPPKYSAVNSVKEKHLYSTGLADGRFTIGTRYGRRLMYGYPIPQSTSHIILKVDSAFGSNYPGFATEYDTIYFSGNLTFSSEEGSLKSEITLMLDSVFITQTLTPVDGNLETVRPGAFGQYYHIAYKIENMSQDEKQVGFMTLLDLMLDDNDGPETYFGTDQIKYERAFAGEEIPDRFISLYEQDEFSDFAAETILQGGKAEKPDSLFIGYWRPFHSFVWNVRTSRKPFGDSGYLLKWNERALAPGEILQYSYYYGLPVEGQLRALMYDNNVKTKKLTIYFQDTGSSKLSEEAKEKIDNLIADHSGFIGGIVEGFGDVVGTEDQNMKVSKKRIKSVMSYMNSKGIKQTMLIPKIYGESQALLTDQTLKEGNLKDRKLVITLFYSK